MDVCAVSLFSGGGFGDCGLTYGAEIPVVACAELLPERAAILSRLFPDAAIFSGSVYDTVGPLVDHVLERLHGRRPFVLIASPPCQGMSSNGMGKILKRMRGGHRAPVDVRNHLVLPALDAAVRLQPEWVVIENVPAMLRTAIDDPDGGEPVLITDLVARRLAGYTIQQRVVCASDYGVPQRRPRLFLVARRGESTADFFPATCPPVTLEQATRHLAPLDALTHQADPDDPLHRVPRWTAVQHFCMAHTAPGTSAFYNDTCVQCGATHHAADAVACRSCRAWLPRPRTASDLWVCGRCGDETTNRRRCPRGHRALTPVSRMLRGFHTSYKRMALDCPANTLTTRSDSISSDLKGHPTQHRVLSLREVLIVASMAPWPGSVAPWWDVAAAVFEAMPSSLLRTVAGESIPPAVTAQLGRHLRVLSSME